MGGVLTVLLTILGVLFILAVGFAFGWVRGFNQGMDAGRIWRQLHRNEEAP